KLPKDDAARVRDLETQLAEAQRLQTEAQEQRIATSEILRVISSSPTDVQPVFDAIVQSAVRLCAARFAAVFRFDGEMLHLGAHNFPPNVLEFLQRQYPMRPGYAQASGRTILSRAVVQIPDLLADQEYQHEWSLISGWRSILGVPMLHEGVPIGAILINRAEPGPFPNTQVELLQTFADQAVIAIENVRLFTELQEKNQALTQAHAQVTEALEQQTATSEILRVISQSPTDVQPVLDAVAENAARLCGADDAVIRHVEGDTLQLVARFGSIPLPDPTRPISRDYPAGLAVIERRTIHIEDISSRLETEFPRVSRGLRTVLATPLLREGLPIGVIVIRRTQVQPFTDKQIALLNTFADQAVIAIENVRLFTELQASNRELTTALDTQTATGEILRIISGSPTDLAPVFDAILASACRLCGANFAALWRVSGEELVGTASYNASREFAEHMKSNPLVPSRKGPTRLAALERRTVHIADMTIEPGFSPVSLHFEKARTVLSA